MSKKPKQVKVELIARLAGDKVTEPYKILERLVAGERSDLAELNIGLAWRHDWKPDRDGLLKLGKCCKRTDLDRELAEYDFVILLNAEVWPVLTGDLKEWLVFHELEHAQLVIDGETEEPKMDDRGRFVCRVRKHDIEEFTSVIERYGSEKSLLEAVRECIDGAETPLLAEKKA